jgi:hypothetical protein
MQPKPCIRYAVKSRARPYAQKNETYVYITNRSPWPSPENGTKHNIIIQPFFLLEILDLEFSAQLLTILQDEERDRDESGRNESQQCVPPPQP